MRKAIQAPEEAVSLIYYCLYVYCCACDCWYPAKRPAHVLKNLTDDFAHT